MNMFITGAIILALAHIASTLPEVIKIGAVFEEGDEWSRYAFEAAIKIINDDESTLPGIKLEAEIAKEPIPQYDIVGVENHVCTMMKAGVVGIVGPHSTEMSNHVQSLCDTMEIPHISARWDGQQRRSSCLVNLYPHPAVLAQVAADMVRTWDWRGFTILYDDFNALRKIGELVKIADDKGLTVSVRQIKGIEGEEDNYRYVLQEVKHSGETNIVVEISRLRLFDVMMQAQQVGLVGSEYSYIVTSLDFQSIDLEPFKWAGTNITGIRMVNPDQPHFKEVMKLIMEMKNQGEGGDGADDEGGGDGEGEKEEVGEGNGGEAEEGAEQEGDLGEEEENTGGEDEGNKRKKRRTQLDDVENEVTGEEDGDGEEGEVGEGVQDGNEGGGEGEDNAGGKENGKEGEDGGGEGETGETPEEPPAEEEEYEIPPIEALLIYDAVNLVAEALHNLDIVEPKEIDCRLQKAWESGYSVINFVKMSEQEGLSGMVKFDNEGFRSEVVLEIVELVQEGLVVKGNWTKQDGVTIHYTEGEVGTPDVGDDLRNTTFIVLIALVSIAGVFLLVLAAVYGQDKGGWEVHGNHQKPNIQTLGGSVSGPRDKLAVDGLRAGDYLKGHVEYSRQLATDGTRALSGHAGLSGDNMGNRAKNFGLEYQDPKNSASWNRELSGPVRTNSFRAERNFYTSPDGKGTLGGYLQHDRNNFGMRNTEGGIVGRWNIG